VSAPRSLLELAAERAKQQGVSPSLALKQEAKRFRLAGLSIADYLSVTDHEREFLVLAGLEDRVEQAIRIGRACAGDESLVLADVDGGDALDRDALEFALRSGL
jgi:hypothetical protein